MVGGASESAAPGNRRPRRRPGENHAILLAAGTVEFGLHGYAATQTSTIARRAGVSQPNVYANFASKRELLLACLHGALVSAESDAPSASAQGSLNDEHALLLYQAVACVRDPLLREDVLRVIEALRTALGDTGFSETLLRASQLLLAAHQ